MTDAPLAGGTRPSSSPVGVLGNRNFVRVFVAGIISTGGSNFASLAIVWVVFARTGSALDVAFVGVAQLAGGILLTLPAGVWVDRYPRRLLMIISDLARAIASAALAIVLLIVGFSLISVLTVSFAWAAAGVLFNPAEQSFLPSLIRPEEIPHANGLIQSSRSITGVVSNSAAGFVILVAGAIPSLWVNVGTFLASAGMVSLVFVRPMKASTSGRAKRAMPSEMKEGVAWLYGQKGLLQLSLSAGPLNFFNAMFQGFTVVFVVVLLHGNPLVLGVLGSLTALGSAVGAMLVGRTGAIHRAGQVWLLSYGLVTGAVVIIVAIHPLLVLAFPLLFVYGLALTYAGSTWLSAAQTLVPSYMQGRYFSIDGLLSWGILPVAEVTGGIAIAAWGVQTTFLVAGAGMVGTALLFLPARSLWRWRVPRPGEEEPLAPSAHRGGET